MTLKSFVASFWSQLDCSSIWQRQKESVARLAVMHCDCLVVGGGQGGGEVRGCNLPRPAVNVGGDGRRRVNQTLDSGSYGLSCCPPAAETGPRWWGLGSAVCPKRSPPRRWRRWRTDSEAHLGWGRAGPEGGVNSGVILIPFVGAVGEIVCSPLSTRCRAQVTVKWDSRAQRRLPADICLC